MTSSSASGNNNSYYAMVGEDQQRQHALKTLELMGFNRDWCLQALDATNDDVYAATEYLLNFASNLEVEMQNEEEVRRLKQLQNTISEEDRWFNEVAFDLKLTSKKIQAKNQVSSSSASLDNEWGFLFTVSPIYSLKTTKALARLPDNKKKLSFLLDYMDRVKAITNETIVDCVNTHCSNVGTDPLLLSPADLPDTLLGLLVNDLDKYRHALSLKFLLVRNFNRRVSGLLPIIDFSSLLSLEAGEEVPIAHNSHNGNVLALQFLKYKKEIFTQVKRNFLDAVLSETHCGNAALLQKVKTPMVILDRHSTKVSFGVFTQLFTQVHKKIPASKLRNSERAFYTILAGEHSDDYGGTYTPMYACVCTLS